MIRYAYLHGLSSSPLATKASRLSTAFESVHETLERPDLNVPSFATLTFDAALAALDDLAAKSPNARWRLIGSSMGGYLAARWAEMRPGRVERMLLLCPGFDFARRWPSLLGPDALARWEREGHWPIPDGTGTPVPVHWGFVTSARAHPAFPEFRCRARIIHGTRDDIVPIDTSRELAARRSNVDLVEVEDDHRLHASPEIINTHALGWLRNSDYHWDFFGPDRAATAAHFLEHLNDFLTRHERGHLPTEITTPQPDIATVTCAAPLGDEALLRNALRPHRKT